MKKLKHIIKTTQNKCMGICLQLDNLKHISHEMFERLNWLPVTYNNVLTRLRVWDEVFRHPYEIFKYFANGLTYEPEILRLLIFF